MACLTGEIVVATTDSVVFYVCRVRVYVECGGGLVSIKSGRKRNAKIVDWISQELGE